jgi:hypothetical protein
VDGTRGSDALSFADLEAALEGVRRPMRVQIGDRTIELDGSHEYAVRDVFGVSVLVDETELKRALRPSFDALAKRGKGKRRK